MSEQLLVPRLRFSEFTSGYKDCKLGEIFSVFNGYAFSSNDAAERGVRWLKIADVGIQEMTPASPSFLPEGFENKHGRFKLKKGDYVVALTRPILKHKLKIAQVNDEYDGSLLNQRVGKLVTKHFENYVYYLLQVEKIIFDIENRIDGTDPPNLSPKEIHGISYLIPCRNEQQKIADFLSAVDQKISQLKQKHALLLDYKKGVMQQLFSQQIRFKDDQGLPFEDWKEVRLRDIATPIKRKASKSVDAVLTISAGRGFLNQEERFSQIIAGSSLDKYTLIKKGEFSYNRGNSKSFTYGCIYEQKVYDEALVPFVYRSFKLHKGVNGFFAYLFQFKYLDRQLRRLISSSARMDGLLNIGEKDFYEVKVVFPEVGEQQKIASLLESIDKKITQVAQQIEQAQQFKKGLLQQMFV